MLKIPRISITVFPQSGTPTELTIVRPIWVLNLALFQMRFDTGKYRFSELLLVFAVT